MAAGVPALLLHDPVLVQQEGTPGHFGLNLEDLLIAVPGHSPEKGLLRFLSDGAAAPLASGAAPVRRDAVKDVGQGRALCVCPGSGLCEDTQ